MLVKNWMSKPAITIDADAPVVDAIHLMHRHEIQTLPVLEGFRLVGIVTAQDLQSASGPDGLFPEGPGRPDRRLGQAINEIMTTGPVTVSDVQTIVDTSELLLVHKVSGLPVVNRIGRVVGMITRGDLLRFILTIVGMGKNGVQFAIELADRPQLFEEITDLMRDFGGRFGTVISTRERAQRGYRQAYIRLYDMDPPSLSRLKEELNGKVKIRYLIHYQDNISEMF